MLKGFFRWANRNYKPIIVAVLMIFAFFIRFYGITGIGISQVDEATYMNEGAWMNGDDYADLRYPLISSKPLFSYLISLSLRFFGHHDYAGIMVSALFGSLTVLVVFFIGCLAYNYYAGLFAAIIITFNKLHIEFSRNAYAESTMLFFFSLAFLFYLLSKRYNHNKYSHRKHERPYKWLFLALAGISIGLSYDSKFLGVVLLIILCLFELTGWLASARRREAWKAEIKSGVLHCMVMSAGFLLVFFATWFFYYLADESYLFYFMHRVDQIDIGHRIVAAIPFLDSIPRLDHDWLAGGNFLSENLAYVFFMYKYFFITTFIFLVVGLIAMLRRRKRQDILFAGTFVLLALFVMKIAYGRPRTLMFFPFIIALIGGFGMDSIRLRLSCWKRVSRKVASVGFILLVFFSVLGSTIWSAEVVSYSNLAFRETGEYIREQGSTGTVSTVGSLMSFYTKSPSTGLPDSCDDLADLRSEGHDFIVIDTWKLSAYDTDSCVWSIYRDGEPVKSFDFTIRVWHIPLAELSAIMKIDSVMDSDILDGFIDMVDRMFLTKKIEQKVLVYRNF